MNIDLTKFRKTRYEDENGKIIPQEENDASRPINAKYYVTLFPCEISENYMHVGYHPVGIQRLLIKLPIIGNIVKKRIGQTFKPVFTGHTNLCRDSQECVVKMVNSGDFTLEQALWVMSTACERCGNALYYKYCDGKDGYPEDSEEYRNLGTSCIFCQEDEGSEEK